MAIASAKVRKVAKAAWALKAEGRHIEGEDLLLDFADGDRRTSGELISLATVFKEVAADYDAAGLDARQSRDFYSRKAFDCLEKASLNKPDDIKLALGAAEAADKVRLTAAAFRHTRRVLELDGKNTEAWTLLSKLYQLTGAYSDSLQCRINAANIRAGNPDRVNNEVMYPTISNSPRRPARS